MKAKLIISVLNIYAENKFFRGRCLEGKKQLVEDDKELKRMICQGIDFRESSSQRNLPLKRNEKSTILP